MEHTRQGVTAVKITQQAGGNQSFNIFGGQDNEPMQKSVKQMEREAAQQAQGQNMQQQMNGN
jgi:hypothetical protein